MVVSVLRGIFTAVIFAAFSNIPARAQQPLPTLPSIEPSSLSTAEPLRYAVTIEPDVMARTFKGRVDIEINVPTTTQMISLHARDLVFDSAELSAPSTTNAPIALTWRSNIKDELVEFSASAPIAAGRYQLKIAYQGKINTRKTRGAFLINGKTPYYEPNEIDGAKAIELQFFTHSQPNDARSIFPSWDEPGYKTPFDAAIVMPAEFKVVGNMPIASTEITASGSVLTRFETTPAMSTYLLFFGAGDFQRVSKEVDDIDYGIVMRKSEKAIDYEVALNSMPEITQYFTDYFAQPYTLRKMDMVLSAKKLDEFEAMENWGAILGHEGNAIDKYPNRTEQIYYMNAHEISHQWIGNAVTPKRWDDLWISEGLAVYLTSRYLDTKFPNLGVKRGIASDSKFIQEIEIKKPIPALKSEKTVQYLDDKDIGSSVYLKGGAVFEMVANAIGDDKWRTILRSYVAEQKGKVVTSDELIAILLSSGEPKAASILTDFTQKPGFPVIAIDAVLCEQGRTRVTLSQRPYPGATANANPDIKTWTVPLFVRSLAGESVTVIDQAQQEINVPGCGAFALNAASKGYYRVDYQKVARSPDFADFRKLKEEDQNNIIIESFGNADAKISAPSLAYELLSNAAALVPVGTISLDPHIVVLAAERLELVRRAYKGSRDPIQTKMANSAIMSVLSELELSLSGMELRYTDPLSYGQSLLKTLLDRTRKPTIQKDFSAIIGSEFSMTMIRTDMFYAAKSEVKSKFRNLDRINWQKFMKQKNANFAYRFIGINKDPAIVRSALNFAMSGKLDEEVRAEILNGAASESPELVLTFLFADPRVKTKLSQKLITDIAVEAAESSENLKWADRLSVFAKTLKDAAQSARLVKAIADMRNRAVKMAQLRTDLGNWVAKHGKL